MGGSRKEVWKASGELSGPFSLPIAEYISLLISSFNERNHNSPPVYHLFSKGTVLLHIKLQLNQSMLLIAIHSTVV